MITYTDTTICPKCGMKFVLRLALTFNIVRHRQDLARKAMQVHEFSQLVHAHSHVMEAQYGQFKASKG